MFEQQSGFCGLKDLFIVLFNASRDGVQNTQFAAKCHL